MSTNEAIRRLNEQIERHPAIAPAVALLAALGLISGAVAFFSDETAWSLLVAAYKSVGATVTLISLVVGAVVLLGLAACVYVLVVIVRAAVRAKQLQIDLDASKSATRAATMVLDAEVESGRQTTVALEALREAHTKLRVLFGRFQIARLAHVHGHACAPSENRWTFHIKFSDHADAALVERIKNLIRDTTEVEATSEFAFDPPLSPSDEGVKVSIAGRSGLSYMQIAQYIDAYDLLGLGPNKIGQHGINTDDKRMIVEVLPTVM